MARPLRIEYPNAIYCGSRCLALRGGQSGWQRTSRSSQVARIEKRIGSFPISDPKLVHIQALETENPKEFAWRIYFPANYKMTLVQRSNSSGSSSSGISFANPTETIFRVRFRENNGLVECFSNLGSSSSLTGIQPPIYAAAILKQWDRLEIEQPGKDRLVTCEPDQEFTFLSIKIPSELLESMKSRFDNLSYGNLSGEITRVQFVKQAP